MNIKDAENKNISNKFQQKWTGMDQREHILFSVCFHSLPSCGFWSELFGDFQYKRWSLVMI